MTKQNQRALRCLTQCFAAAILFATATACQTGVGGVKGNDSGSNPINDEEAIKYNQALIRCHKTGGHRVVKIEGKLRCYN